MNPKYAIGAKIAWIEQRGYARTYHWGVIENVMPAEANGGMRGQLQDEVSIRLDQPIVQDGYRFLTVGGPIGRFSLFDA